MSKARRILSDVIFVVVIAAIVLGSLLFALNRDPEKTIFGYRAYNILSGSMEPELSVGDLVIVKAVPAEEIQTGDIVTYYPTEQGGATVTHRVVRTFLEDGQIVLETQGDAVNQTDPMFYGDAVIGVVVFHIPLLGAVIAWIQQHPIPSLLILLALAGGLWVLSRWNARRKLFEKTPTNFIDTDS